VVVKRHPRNTDFHWHTPKGPRRLLADSQIAAYDRDGAIVLEDVFDPTDCSRLCAALDPLAAETEAFLRSRQDGRFLIGRAGEISFSPHLVARSAVLREASMHPQLLDLLHDLIGPDVRLYWDQAVYKGATPHDFPWHQDNGYTYVEPQQYVTCWIALTDATIANGCPWILPGAHRLGTLAHRWTELGFACWDGSQQEREHALQLLRGELQGTGASTPDDLLEPRALELRAGSMAVFSSLTPHRTGPNTTDGVRRAYIVQYAPAGATMFPLEGPPVRADNPEWQYPVLTGGRPSVV
jgi:ectoine hydroxylase-related dioxygenase (phytanoyl-CoA dioxygenase family)